MGNLIPLDAAKKQECEDIAKEFLATFNVQYVLAYGVEFVKMKIKQIEDEACEVAGIEKQLMYRESVKRTEPHKIGKLTKKGAIIKNWKHRYFVVNPDFSVSYYESEEVYHNGGKPKGVIHLAGYEVAESADNSKIEKLKALAKILGLDAESLPLPDKFPAHTLALSHDRRRTYYIMAADEDEKKEWVEMFKTCCRKTNGLKNEDPVAQAAFKTAYRQACDESNLYRRLKPSGGTEEQVLTETLVDLINQRVLSSVYSELTGTFAIRKKIRNQVMKMLDSMVLALVIPAYKALVATTEKMKEPMEKTFNDKKDEIYDVQRKIISFLADKMETIFNKAVEEATADIKSLYEDLKELTVRTSTEMRNECVVRLMERLIKDTKESQNVAEVMKKNYRKFDGITERTSAWDHWYKVYNIEKEAIKILDKYQETFDMGGEYSYVYASHDMLAKVADAAFFTFEQTLEERTKDSDILNDNAKASESMEKVKDEVIPKYDHDSEVTPQEISFALTTTHIVTFIRKKIDPLTKEIIKAADSEVPEPLQQLISIQERYESFIEQSVKEIVRRANGISELEKKSNKEEKTTESEKTQKQNGEARIEEMKEEKVNEPENEKAEGNGREEEETPKDEVLENGNTTEECNEETKEIETSEGKESEKNEEGKESEKKEGNGDSAKNGIEENHDAPEKPKENGSSEEVNEVNNDTAM